MNIEKFGISRDPVLYLAWPDLALLPDGRLLCIFSECTHHRDRSYTRIMLTESADRGRHWTPRRPLTEGTAGLPYYYNCPRLSTLRDGRLAVTVDRVSGRESSAADTPVLLYLSDDAGNSWSPPRELPLRGIVPDKLHELDNGRWITGAHHPVDGCLRQFVRYSDDAGATWSPQTLAGALPNRNLCEISLLPMGGGVLAAFMRENSGLGLDCHQALSFDNGTSWGPVTTLPIPGCHRPVAGFLQDGRIMLTYRFLQGGKSRWGGRAQNFFAAFTDRESVLSGARNQASARIIPIDYDAADAADLGYSGWVQFPDGEIYVANYIVDDARTLGQIRGYAFSPP